MQNLKNNVSADSVKSIGLVVDTSDFNNTELLIKELLSFGILPKNIKTIVYNEILKKNDGEIHPIFSDKHFNWNGEFSSADVNAFVNEKFDLLISYYDLEKAILLQITNNSKAHFKVGFSSIDKRLNHFMIKTELNNYSIFTTELFKYLKLLNKI